LKDNGFLVFAGSVLRIGVRASASALFQEQRKAFIEKQCNVVKGVPVTKCDYLFSSPSVAAGMFIGGSANGWTEWKDKEGKTLDQVYRSNK